MPSLPPTPPPKTGPLEGMWWGLCSWTPRDRWEPAMVPSRMTLPITGFASSALSSRPHPGPGHSAGGDGRRSGVHLHLGDGVLSHHSLQPPCQVGRAGGAPWRVEATQSLGKLLLCCCTPAPPGTGQCWTTHCGRPPSTKACVYACWSAAGCTLTLPHSHTCDHCRPSATPQPASQWMW